MQQRDAAGVDGHQEVRRLEKEMPPEGGIDSFRQRYAGWERGYDPAKNPANFLRGAPPRITVDHESLSLFRGRQLRGEADELPDWNAPVLQQN